MVGCFIGDPVAGTGDDLEAQAGLEFIEHALALVEIGMGAGVAPAPDPGQLRRHPRQCPDQRVGSRKTPAPDPAARRVHVLDVDGKVVDLALVADHQHAEIVPGDGEQLLDRPAGLLALELGRLARQAEAVRADDRKAAHLLTQQCRDMAAEHPAERDAGEVKALSSR